MSTSTSASGWALGTLGLFATVVGAQLPEDRKPCPLILTEVARELGIDFVHDPGGRGAKALPETMGAGLAWLDVDLDGWLDLYLVQSGPFPGDEATAAGDRLYRGLGGLRSGRTGSRAVAFEALSELGARGYGQGVVAGDADGDGAVDLYLTRYGPDILLLNRLESRGRRWFADATAEAGLGLGGWSTSAAFGDADGDGDLDLYVARYLDYQADGAVFCGDRATGRRRYCDPSLFLGAPDRLYENLGRGLFRDATDAAGLAGANGKGLGVVFADLDGDRRPELYVANDLTLNLLYRNVSGAGVARFEDRSLISGTAVDRDGKPEAGMGVAVGDLDADGDPDVVVTNFDVETNTLYRNLGELQFVDASAQTGFGPASFNLLGFGVVVADLDRDGALDVYVGNGHIFEQPRRENVSHAQPDLLLRGSAAGRFVPVPCASGEKVVRVGRGVAAGDFDNDGDVDLGVQNNGGPFELLRNDTPLPELGDWIGVRLLGRPPNTEAVGAQVTLTVGKRQQRRWVLAGSSYLSSGDRRLLFGIEARTVPRELEIIWPSGRMQTVMDPPASAYLTFYEPEP